MMADECTISVMAGVCRKNSKIHVKQNDDGMTVTITIESDCPMVSKNPLPTDIVAWEEVGAPFNQSRVYAWASENIRHTACPVPCCIIKGIEVASGLGLKKNPEISIE